MHIAHYLATSEHVRRDAWTVLRLAATACVLLATAVLSLLLFVMPSRRVRQRYARTIVRVGAQLLLRALGVARDVRGPTPRGPALLVSNHLSWLDVVVVAATWRCTFIAKREMRAWPFIGSLGTALGVVFVDRVRKRDLLRTIPAIEARLRAGDVMLLFPEGTTTDGAGVLPFRSALFEAAVRANAPVFPLSLSGQASHIEALSWIGDETLLANVPRVASLQDACISLRVGAPITAGTNRKRLAFQSRQAVLRRFVAPSAVSFMRNRLRKGLGYEKFPVSFP